MTHETRKNYLQEKKLYKKKHVAITLVERIERDRKKNCTKLTDV